MSYVCKYVSIVTVHAIIGIYMSSLALYFNSITVTVIPRYNIGTYNV